MKRFLFFNCVGQTGGSFFVDCLQYMGVACVDEFFNPRVFRPGKHTDSIFGEGVCKETGDKTSLYAAFDYIESIAPKDSVWIGVKVCSSQRHPIHDFKDVINDPSILKILHYRHSLNYYLTKYFHHNWARIRGENNAEYRLNPDPFFHYAAYKTEGMKNWIDVESEDLFDLCTNSMDALSDILGLDSTAMKEHAISQVKDAPLTTIEQLGADAGFDEERWSDMRTRFELVPYPWSLQARVRDCRSINGNLGFI